MGKRGPKPQPSIIKYIRGNPSKEALPTDEPTPDLLPIRVQPPEWLEGRAVEVWHKSVERLSNMRVLTEADVPAVARYCVETTLYLACYEKVKTAGEEYIHWEPDPNRTDGKLRIKYTQVAPWATQMNRHHANMLQIEREFGMTPSSRTQISTGIEKQDDPIRAFAKKRSDRAGA